MYVSWTSASKKFFNLYVNFAGKLNIRITHTTFMMTTGIQFANLTKNNNTHRFGNRTIVYF